MFIDIEFFNYKENITLYHKKELDVNILVRQLVKAEAADHPTAIKEPSKTDKFIETLLTFGWEIVLKKESISEYWFDRDTFMLGRLSRQKRGYKCLKTDFMKLYRKRLRFIQRRLRHVKK